MRPFPSLARAFLLAPLVLGAGCDGCRCARAARAVRRTAEAITRAPTQAEAQAELERQLQTNPQVFTTICGVPVERLSNLVIRVQSTTLGMVRASVEGETTSPSDAGVDRGRLLRCVAVVTLSSYAVLTASGGFDHFNWGTVTVDAVSTPGVTFTRPRASGGHHHHG